MFSIRTASVVFLASIVGCARSAPPAAAPAPRDSARFYHAVPYGSEAQFNPLSEVLNEGFDMLRQDNRERELSKIQYRAAARNVFGALIHADSAVRHYGLWNALHDEVLPLSFSGDGGQWVPNYTVHLIGSGMVSAKMREWYAAHDIPHPELFSAATMFTAHFINEAIEDGGRPNRPLTVDPIADLYIFDLGGILLFQTQRVQSLFDNRCVTLNNWPGQPTINLPLGTLENTTQEFVMRTMVPGATRWRGMLAFGVSTVIGASYGDRDGLAYSLGVGSDGVKTRVIDTLTDKKTVDFKPVTGFFIDRRGSLLFSMFLRDSKEIIAEANLYPGVIRVHGATFGLWTELLSDRRWRIGLVPVWGLGIGDSGRHPLH